ncbi:MAG: TonB-dependent receptor [Acidobacteria bacterium]|nr:TonB-dependent receptor [Acidobacteriota bacterium]
MSMIVAGLCAAELLAAQIATGGIRGVVADASGAVIAAANVELTGPSDVRRQAQTDQQGRYQFDGLPPAEYTIQVSVPGFERHESRVKVAAGRMASHRLNLTISSVRSEVTVADQGEVTVDPGGSVGAVVIQGENLKALSDNRDRLEEDLQALAGPSVGPSGGEIFVDGFSGGKLPSKASIREIRVNQNPFSAEYDRLGYGRVEIFTRPGTDRFRGEAGFEFGDARFNSRNPFATDKPASQRKMLQGNVAGPLGKRSSFYVALERFNIQETSIINALTLDASMQDSPFRQALVSPVDMTEIETRVDRQLSTNHTLIGRFFTEKRNMNNSGLSTFTLPTRAATVENRESTFQVTETALIGPSAVHEVRFQYSRDTNTSRPASTAIGIQVPEAFSGGGSNGGTSIRKDTRFEVSDLFSISRGRHMVKAGVRVRNLRPSDLSMSGYNGSFLFSSLDAYRITEAGLLSGFSAAQIRAAGGGASQFTLAAGDPLAEVAQTDAGMFVQDDWRLHPRFTLTAGLRYEAQTNLSDRRNFAPRIGIAWAPGQGTGVRSAGVIRAGFGMFYERVGTELIMEALRLDGVHQREYVVPNPDFYPAIPSLSLLAGNVADQAVRRVDGNLRSPYIMQAAFTYERALPGNTTMSVTYSNARGVRVLRSRNINAPVPGLLLHPFSGGNIYQYESSGFFRQNQVLVNWNSRVTRRVSLLGYYAWGKAYSDSDGPGSFPANSYNLAGEYARAGFDARHRVMLGGSIVAPYGLMLSPLVTASSGLPFNITAGQDLNGDSIFNDRPAWAAGPSGPGTVRTAYGTFDTAPAAGQSMIPRNLGNGPRQIVVNLRATRSFGFGESADGAAAASGGEHHGGGGHGPGGPGGAGPGLAPGAHVDDHGRGSSDRRYTLTFSLAARNLLNTVNLAPPVGNLSSPLFGTSVATAGGRRGGGAGANRILEMSVRFSF